MYLAGFVIAVVLCASLAPSQLSGQPPAESRAPHPHSAAPAWLAKPSSVRPFSDIRLAVGIAGSLSASGAYFANGGVVTVSEDSTCCDPGTLQSPG